MWRARSPSRSRRRCRDGWRIGSSRSRRVRSRVARALTIAMLVFVAACAKKPAVAPAVPGAPHYPDYVFPVAPAALAPPAVVAQYEQAWRTLQSGDTKAADRDLSAVLKQTPSFYPAEAALGYSALARKDAGAAIGRFERALAMNAAYAP